MSIDLIDELKWRGLFHQCTDEPALRQHLGDPANHPRSAYVGYDPTADSLTIGNLVTIMLLVHFWRAGHVPVAIVGGGTGMIGDPSGKSAERQLLTMEQVNKNIDGQRPIFERLFTNAAALEGRPAFTPRLINNADWLMGLGYIEALRDIGKHFSVNEMIKKDSVRMRLEQRDQGISYTEFSYMILQSYDFLVLFRDFAKYGLKLPVTLQMGGSDQWGNIVGGTELAAQTASATLANVHHLLAVAATASTLGRESPEQILARFVAAHREFQQWIVLTGRIDLSDRFSEPMKPGMRGADYAIETQEKLSSIADLTPHIRPFGLTAPLITKSDGGKFGKTESGAIWLTPERTSPYAYHQFWLNSADADMGKFLRIFTLLPRERIEAIEAEHAKDPSQRLAQRELADAATALLHGPAAVEQSKAAARALFSGGGGDVASLPRDIFTDAMSGLPTTDHPRASLAPPGLSLLDLLAQTSLAKSKSEARQALTENSVSVNGAKADLKRTLSPADLLHDSYILLSRGKRNKHLTRWS
jgi:tyrosyl-tRNA synthetase